MNLKFTCVAAAIAGAMSVSTVQARIVDGTSGNQGNAEWVFSAFDIEGGQGYTLDLLQSGFDAAFGTDTRLNTVIGADVPIASAPTGVVAAGSVGIPIYRALLPNFSSFLQTAGVDASRVTFNVVAAETFGRNRLVSTVGSDPALVAAMTNDKTAQSSARFNGYVSQVNSKGENVGTTNAFDGTAQTVPADGTAYPGNAATWGDNFGNNSNFLNTGNLGDSLPMYMYYQTSTTNLQQLGGFAALTQGGAQVFASVYNTPEGYVLEISAVPEPETYALMVAGLGLVAGAALRRQRKV